MSTNLTLFPLSEPRQRDPDSQPVKRLVACAHCNLPPDQMAPPHPDDSADAIGLNASDYGVCCAVHYVRRLRWKYDLDD